MNEQWFGTWESLMYACRAQALRSWRDDYAPAIAITDLFANHLRRLRIVLDELPGGNYHILIKVQPRRSSELEWYWFKARRLAGRYYLL